jgi:hypothetical protein
MYGNGAAIGMVKITPKLRTILLDLLTAVVVFCAAVVGIATRKKAKFLPALIAILSVGDAIWAFALS